MTEKTNFYFLSQRIQSESERFENRVKGKPFIPKPENIDSYYRNIYKQHCDDLNQLSFRDYKNINPTHHCWMSIKNKFLYLSEDNYKYDDTNQFKTVTDIISTIKNGFFHTTSPIPFRFIKEAIIIIYLVYSTKSTESLLKCNIYSIPEDIEELTSFLDSEKFKCDYISLHIANDYNIVKNKENIDVIKSLSLQFQREWGAQEEHLIEQAIQQNKAYESKNALKSIISHDLCHSLYECINSITGISDLLLKNKLNTEINSLNEILNIEQILISMFGIPFMQRSIEESHSEEKLFCNNNIPNTSDAFFWRNRFEYIINSVINARGNVKKIKVDYKFQANGLLEPHSKQLPLETSEQKILLAYIKNIPSDVIWPLSYSSAHLMQYQGEIATITGGFTEMLRNAINCVLDEDDNDDISNQFSKISVTVNLSYTEYIFSGEVINFCSFNCAPHGGMNRVAKKLMTAYPGLTINHSLIEDKEMKTNKITYFWNLKIKS